MSAWQNPGVKIHGAEHPIKDIFSDEFVFKIPSYQRPYAWEEEQAGELIDDLLLAIEGPGDIDELEPYFLGSLVLIKPDGADSEVIDGQQRLTTLTILFSALAELAADETKGFLYKYLSEPGNPLEGLEPQPRLTLRERDSGFFRENVQDPGGLSKLIELDPRTLSDPQRCIAKNARLLHAKLDQVGAATRDRLAPYLLRHCYVVVVSTDGIESAYRIFSVLNDRGLELSAADILKATVIGGVPNEQEAAYTKRWEDAEEELGRDPFSDLFSHLRMIHLRRKLKGTIVREFREEVLVQYPDKALFIDDVLGPYADAFTLILKGTDDPALEDPLRWLRMLDNFDWIPPALEFFVKHPDPAERARFLKSLERLAASLFVRRRGINDRIDRYARLLGAIQDGADLYGEGSPLQLDAEERAKTIAALDGDIYTLARVPRWLLLRLDSALSDGSASYELPVISVEHVLPQGPAEGSQWRKDFDEEAHLAWVHRLGNLVLLSHRKNSQANNYDFKDKKEKYFVGAGGAAPFVITMKVVSEPVWTIGTLERRQAEAVATLTGLWDLAP